MNTYSLSVLLKVREQKKSVAELSLREAMSHHESEEKKLSQMKSSLTDLMLAREQLQNNFFMKGRCSPYNKREITCHVSSNQKNIYDEHHLRKCLENQEEAVKFAAMKLDIAKSSAVDAHKNLKVIEKHFSSWQLKNRRLEETKEEYANDDQNGVRFILRKA